MAGTSAAIRRIASSPAAVLNVSSAQGIPPAMRALERGTALSSLSIYITGTIPIFSSYSITLFILTPVIFIIYFIVTY
jgi:hypothetical protein